MDFGFVLTDDPLWSQLLHNIPHDFYHLPSYLDLTSKYEGGMPTAFYAKLNDSLLFVPMLIRPLPDCLGVPKNWVDSTSPYGYASPIFFGLDDVFLRAALHKFIDACRQLNIITFFARLHPILHFPHNLLSEFGEIVIHGQCVNIDLNQPVEELWRQTRNDHRNHIRKAERLGFTAEIDEWARFEDFVDIYTETMNRVGAVEFYHFTKEYFFELKSALGSALHLCSILSPEGDVACAGLFPEINGIVQFHLSGTAKQYLSNAPTKLMLHSVRNWSKQNGFNWLNLGGGLGSQDDALFEFKAGFSKIKFHFHTFRMISDMQRYTELINIDMRFREIVFDGFFPPYRKNI